MTIGLNKNKSIYQPILSQIKIPLKQPGGAVSNKEDYLIFTRENNLGGFRCWVMFLVGAIRLHLVVLFLFKTGRFGLNIGLKSCFVVTQFPQK